MVTVAELNDAGAFWLRSNLNPEIPVDRAPAIASTTKLEAILIPLAPERGVKGVGWPSQTFLLRKKIHPKLL